MRFIVQVRIEPDTTTSDAPGSVGGNVVEIAVVERSELSSATVGLSVEDAKTILAGVQDTVVAEHCRAERDIALGAVLGVRQRQPRAWHPVSPSVGGGQQHRPS